MCVQVSSILIRCYCNNFVAMSARSVEILLFGLAYKYMGLANPLWLPLWCFVDNLGRF